MSAWVCADREIEYKNLHRAPVQLHKREKNKWLLYQLVENIAIAFKILIFSWILWDPWAANWNRFPFVPCYLTVFKRGPQLPWPQSQAQQFPRWRPAHQRGGPVERLEEFGRWARLFHNEPLAQKAVSHGLLTCTVEYVVPFNEKRLISWPLLMLTFLQGFCWL